MVDDHEINRLAIEVMLRPLGADLTMAADGEAALALAARQGFDAILMDVRMPGLNGLEAARMLRDTAGPNRHTPVIAVTGDGSAGDIEACRRAGMTGHVLKPIDPAQLYASIMDALAPPLEGVRRPTPQAMVGWPASRQFLLDSQRPTDASTMAQTGGTIDAIDALYALWPLSSP